jgi:glucokinase
MATVGVDLGGTKCLGVLLDEQGTVLAEHRVPTPRGEDAVLDALGDVAERLVATSADLVTGVGLGVPGLVDARGVLRVAPNLPGVVDADIRGVLGTRLGLHVQVENDASAAAWAEREVGAGRQRQHMILVTLGTGIGGGIVTDGRLYRGAHGFAGEIGHMIVNPAGPRCPCGQKGCWERYGSGSGLGWLGREAALAGQGDRIVALAGGDAEQVKGEHVTAAAADGDAEAIAIMREFAWWIGLGLANLANAFDPEAFVLGGGLVEAGDVLLVPVREAFADLVEGSDHRPRVDIVPAALGEHAGAIGAALLARPGP